MPALRRTDRLASLSRFRPRALASALLRSSRGRGVLKPALRAVGLAVAILLVAGSASATPAFPPPLERIVHETTLIVTGRLKTRPVHVGDVYELEVDETLKGAAPAAPLKVRSPGYFMGCVVEANAPPPAAIEAEAKRVLVFVEATKDGVAQPREVVKLDPDEGRSVQMGEWSVAGVGLATVRALVRLDAEATDAKAGAALWAEGLAGDNLLLVHALLERLAPAAAPEADAGASHQGLGETLVRRARRDLAEARPMILAAAMARCAATNVDIRERALSCAVSVARAGNADDRPLLAPALEAARTASRGEERWVRENSLRLLLAVDDADAFPAVIDALRRDDKDGFATWASVAFARDLALRDAVHRDAIVGELVALLGRPVKGGDCAMQALTKLTGKTFADAAGWKAWWNSRKK